MQLVFLTCPVYINDCVLFTAIVCFRVSVLSALEWLHFSFFSEFYLMCFVVINLHIFRPLLLQIAQDTKQL